MNRTFIAVIAAGLAFMVGFSVRSRIEDHRLAALLAVHWSGDTDEMVAKVRTAMSRLKGVECKEP